MSDDNGINEIDNVPMALFIDEMMEDHPLTDEEVATRIGYSAAEIRMFRQGTVKVAFDVIPDLADAIGADRRGLMERALREYLPELVSTLIDLYGTFTEDQWKIIKMIGELNGLWESGGVGGSQGSKIAFILQIVISSLGFRTQNCTKRYRAELGYQTHPLAAGPG